MAKKGEKKTNAMRFLDREKCSYRVHRYESETAMDGVSVAAAIGKDVQDVYKTLVAKGHSGKIYVYVIPVHAELDLKKAAVAAQEKNIEMVHVKELKELTGYVRGGCSPIGMKKTYETFVDASAQQRRHIVVSGGRIGVQVELNIEDLISCVHGQTADVV